MDKPFDAYRGDQPYIFISYAHADRDAVFPVMTSLRDAGLNIWYDDGIQPGSTWREEVALALTQSSLLIYFVTPNSARSENCHQELNFALSRERKVLAVHLEDTRLSMGIELSLSNKQAIIRSEHTEEAFFRKLSAAVREMMPKQIAAIDLNIDAPITSRKTISILPFTNRSSDPENDYLCDGIAEELISGLATVDGITVASQLSSFGLRGHSLSSQQIGQKLNVAHVLTGSIQKAGNRVRITVTLTETDTDTAIWSERYQGELDDIFELQEEVASKVVEALHAKLVHRPVREHGTSIIDTGTRNVQAYDLFLRGCNYFWQATRTARNTAAVLFQQAIDLDPSFGRAWYYAFINNWLLYRFDGKPFEAFQADGYPQFEGLFKTDFRSPRSRTWFLWELEPDKGPDLRGRANVVLNALKNRDPDWNGSQYYEVSTLLSNAGLIDGALRYMEWYEAHHSRQVIDTNNFQFHGNLLLFTGRFEQAIEHFSNAYAMQPQAVLLLGTRAMVYSRTGQFSKAQADLIELSKTFPRNFAQFYDLFWRREVDAAQAYFEWLDTQKNLGVIFKVWSCWLMDKLDRGFDHIEEERRKNGIWTTNAAFMRYASLYPLKPSQMEDVRSHPRYQQLLAETGLDDAWRDELRTRVNELEPITGIRVELDQGY